MARSRVARIRSPSSVSSSIPFVDRLLIAVGVIAIFILGRLPLWILAYLIVRDIILLIGGRYLLAKVGKVPPVVYVGKFATAFIMFGFCLLLLGMPELPGLACRSARVASRIRRGFRPSGHLVRLRGTRLLDHGVRHLCRQGNSPSQRRILSGANGEHAELLRRTINFCLIV